MYGILILVIKFVYCDITKPGHHCVDDFNISRSVNTVWSANYCSCKCIMYGNRTKVSCENCNKMVQKQGLLDIKINPHHINFYFTHKSVLLYCDMYEGIQPLLLVTSKEVGRINETHVEIGGKHSKTNVLICLICRVKVGDGMTKCYNRFDNAIFLIIQPAHMAIYSPGQQLEITCEVEPKEFILSLPDIRFVKHNSTSKITDMRKATINGKNMGTICFTCGHEIVKNVTKCFKYYDKRMTMVIQPMDTRIFIPNLKLHIYCQIDPPELLRDNLLSNISFFQNYPNVVLSKSLDIYLNGNENTKLCFTCSHKLFPNLTRCYDYFDENVTLYISPTDTKIYLPGQKFEIRCLSYPEKVITIPLIDNISITFNNSTYPLVSKRLIIMDGKNVGRVLVKCSHSILKEAEKFYDYYDKPISLRIHPVNTKIYLPKTYMDIMCFVEPVDVVLKKLISNISFIFNNSTFAPISNQLIKIDGKDVGLICMVCGHRMLKNATKCYEHYRVIARLSIAPADTDVYLPKIAMNVYCIITPQEILDKKLISDISFTSTVDSVVKVGPLHALINDIIFVEICFDCEHELFKSSKKCYQYYDQPINLTIYPSDTSIYLVGQYMEIFCEIMPQQLKSLIRNIRFVENNSTSKIIDQHKVSIDGSNMGTICFTCGNEIVTNVTKCYKCYDGIMTLEIFPNDLTIYIPKQILMVRCVITPEGVFDESLISSIRFILNNSTKPIVGHRTIIYDGVDRGTICFQCANSIMKSKVKCYTCFNKVMTTKIIPQDSAIYFVDQSIIVYCEINPPELLINKLITNISFTTNYKHSKLLNKTYIIMDNFQIPYPKICVFCKHNYIREKSRCYDPIEHYNITIFPNKEPIYLIKSVMTVYCIYFPKQMPISINIIHVDVSHKKLGPRNITFGPLNENPYPLVCVVCGHPLIGNTKKCYKPFYENIKMKIEPNTENIYKDYPNKIVCSYSPLYIEPEHVTFKLNGLEQKYYATTDILTISISSDLKYSPIKICLQCGNLHMNTSRCYNVTNSEVELEIFPRVNYYLTYEDDMYIWCETHPSDAKFQLTDFTLTNFNAKYVKLINNTHIRICYPKDSCAITFCVDCSHSHLSTSRICYKPYSDNVRINISPDTDDIYYMTMNKVQCTFHPDFISKDQVKFEVKNLIENTHFIKRNNLTIEIIQSIYIVNTKFCVYCQVKVNIVQHRCYDLAAHIKLDYTPKYKIYLNYYLDYNISTFFTWRNKTFGAKCAYHMGIHGNQHSGIFTDMITLYKGIASGIYHFKCRLPNNSYLYNLSLVVYDSTINATILPITDIIHFMENPKIQCHLWPIFVEDNSIEISLTGLSNDQFKIYGVGIKIEPIIILLEKKICIFFKYEPIIQISKCYILKANVTFDYHEKHTFYCTTYENKPIYTFYQHYLSHTRLETDCFSENVSMAHDAIGGIIQIDKLATGTYKYKCYLSNSIKYEYLNINIYNGAITLAIYPLEKTGNFTPNTIIYCQYSPMYLNLTKFNLETDDLPVQNNKKNQIILNNSLTVHKRCLCFHCQSQYNLDLSKCYKFEVTYRLKIIPLQKLYFAFTDMKIMTTIYNSLFPFRAYPVLCSYRFFSNFTFAPGSITLNKFVANGTYDLTCTNHLMRVEVEYTIVIFSMLVILKIYPNETELYLINQKMDVKCHVYPTSVIHLFPNIRFIYINSTNIINVTKRHIILGGVKSKVHDVICLVCGHESLPYNYTKCYRPYSGKINITIVPLEFDLYFFNTHKIVCRFEPRFVEYSKVKFFVQGIPQEGYKLTANLEIILKKDKTLINRQICVICGHTSHMNKSRCYRLLVIEDSKVYMYVVIGIILIVIVALTVYIHMYEIM